MAPRSKSTPPAETANSFEHALLGHAQPQATLRSAIESDRLHQGWLLHGPKGVGKARFAAQASGFLLAEAARQAGEGLSFDTQDPQARLLAQGAHPDAHWIDRFTGLDGKKPPKQIPVGTVRSTLQKLQSTAAYGGWRTLVVDSVDELNIEGANALLKPLEEPPHQTLILLIAHSLAGVLPTIRSRCRPLAFSSLDGTDMARWATSQSLDDDLIGLCAGRLGVLSQLAANPDVVEVYATFCTLAAQAGTPSANVADRLPFAAAFNALDPEGRLLLLGLLEDWLSRRVRGQAEPPPFASPQLTLGPSQMHPLAQFWSEQTAAVSVRQAINVDLSERMMALFQCLDDVYSQSEPA